MKKQTNRGFLQLILIIVIALIILGYFGLNIREILEKPVVQNNLAWFWDFLQTVWSYLKGPALWVWEHVLKFLWELFRDGLGNVGSGSSVEN